MKRAGIWSVLVLAIAPAMAGQSYEELMKRGDGADVRGKTKKAAFQYQAAIKVAATPEQLVAALLAYTDAVRGTVPNRDLDAETAAAIELAYQRAVVEARGLLSFKAHNDYAVFLLDRGRPAEAVDIFKSGEPSFDGVPADTVARYLANYGLAHARSGHPEDALKVYRSALEKDPSFTVPAAAIDSVISGFEPARAAAEEVTLIDQLLRSGRTALARTYIDKMIATEAWHGETAAMERLVRLIVDWFIATEATPEAIAAEWLPKLEHLAADFDDAAREKVEQLVRVYKGNDLPAAFDGDVSSRFTRWRAPEERRRLAALLLQAGHAAAEQNEPARAAQRYIAAWELDRENLGALTYLTDLLSTWNGEASGTLFDQLISMLFEQKGAAIGSGDVAGQLRLHMLLGSIFESREMWGPRWDPRSAAFQYARALGAYERLQAKEDAPLYPGIHAKLALALEKIGDKAGAWSQYVSAADVNVRGGDVESAEEMLRLCAALGYEPAADEMARAVAVRRAVDAHNLEGRVAAAGPP
jgi:tetratricopeptide (TPR) repeat protein